MAESNNGKLRVAVYCRVGVSGTHEVTSDELLREYFRRLKAKNPQWVFAGMYCDEGKSNNDGRLKMLEDVRAGKCDLVVIRSMNCLSNNMRECLNIISALLKLNPPVSIFFETERLFTSDEKLGLLWELLEQQENEIKRCAMEYSRHRSFKSGCLSLPEEIREALGWSS